MPKTCFAGIWLAQMAPLKNRGALYHSLLWGHSSICQSGCVELAGLPFAVVLMLFMWGLIKAMKQDAQVEQDTIEQLQAELKVLGAQAFVKRQAAFADKSAPTEIV
jgi:choline-glycine betaine transporter